VAEKLKTLIAGLTPADISTPGVLDNPLTAVIAAVGE